MGRPDESREHFSLAESAAGRSGSPEISGKARLGLKILDLYSRGKADRTSVHLDSSIRALEESVEGSRQLGSELEIKCLRQLSLSQLARGRRESFLALNKQALALARDSRDRGEQAKCLINLGIYDFGARNYNRALNDYSEAAELARSTGNKPDELLSLKNMGTILMELGFHQQSLDCLQAALGIDRLSGTAFMAQDIYSLGQAFRNKGLVLSSRPDILRSIEFFQEALDLAGKEGDARSQLTSLNNLGGASLELGFHHTALHYFNSAHGLAQELQDQGTIRDTLRNTAVCRLEMGSPEQAKTGLERALDLTMRNPVNADLWETLFYLGRCHEKLGDDEPALTCYRKSVDAIDYVRSRIRMDDFKAGFARNKALVYESLVALLLKQRSDGVSGSSPAEVFSVVERAKARAFFEILAAGADAPAEDPSSDLLAAERQLSSEIAILISRLSGKRLDREQKLKVDRELRQKEEEHIRLLSRIKAGLKGADGLASPIPPSLDQIQDRLLDEKTAVLEYLLGREVSFLMLITCRDLRIFPIPSGEAIAGSLRAYIRLLSEPPQGEWQGLAAGHRLYEILLSEALASTPRTIEHLVVIPDGPLTGLPFETLPVPVATPGKAAYLISKYRVSYGASCSSLLFLKERGRRGGFAKSLLAVGDPVYPRRKAAQNKGFSEAAFMQDIYESEGFGLDSLKESRREIRSVAGFFPGQKADAYLERDATEGRLKSAALGDYEVVHLACHAFQDEMVPFRSGLFLSQTEAQAEDGFLQAREVAALRLRAEMVVLSACRTSSGYTEAGEGAMGLSRAFFFAGARSIVSSLWEVSDRAAADFMPRFYRRLSQGETKAQALRSAKLETLNSRFAHPFFWAAFVLAGEPSGMIAAD
ncbi:MAG: hypothetical protein A2W03_18650 [Candidatus Aminicenantes bacterium RBG_16_63_16]|nr:MAG: hypothetical protein A2W03_18650 [Candidatus Aminicenantes bacterium RBG_16_63_16]